MRAEWDFFLAHAEADSARAEELYDLVAGKARVFLDSRSLVLGDDWDRELAAAQRLSRVTVVLISQAVSAAYYQREEIAAALDRARRQPSEHRVVPVYLEPAAGGEVEIPYGLRLKQGLSLEREGSLEAVAARLVDLLPRLDGLHETTVSKSARALERLSSGKPRESLHGLHEVTGVYRPLQGVLLAILGLDLLLLAACVVAPGLDRLIDRGLAASVLGTAGAGVLSCVMVVFNKSMNLAREIILRGSVVEEGGVP